VSREAASSEFTVLVLAPTGRNAEAATALLSRAGIGARACASLAQLCAGLEEPVGAVLIEEEAIASPRAREELSACLSEQPRWSDLPFIVLTRTTLPARRELPARRLPEALGNVMFLERPLHAFTFTNAIQTALRARRRQYQVRDHLAEREQTAAQLRELSLRIYGSASQYAAERGLLLADTKFEFGWIDGLGIVLADEVLTPDSSRYWPAAEYAPGGPQPSFDKQYVRDYLESIRWNKRAPAPSLPDDVVQKTQQKYLDALEILTGSRDLAALRPEAAHAGASGTRT